MSKLAKNRPIWYNKDIRKDLIMVLYKNIIERKYRMASNKKEKEQVVNFYSKQNDIENMIKENQVDFGRRFYDAFDLKYLDIDEQNEIIQKYDNAINKQISINDMEQKNINMALDILSKRIGKKANTSDLVKAMQKFCGQNEN